MDRKILKKLQHCSRYFSLGLLEYEPGAVITSPERSTTVLEKSAN
jgi:hypothetical protein